MQNRGNNAHMASLCSLNVSLTSELEGFVKDRVASGRYATSSEVVREGLRLLQLREREAEEAFTFLKAQLKRGTDQADRGEFVDTEEVFKKARAIIDGHRSSAAVGS
jgi:antitoxin ParD1/3/4